MYPALKQSSAVSDEVMIAQEELARIQSQVGKLVKSQTDVNSVRWVLDKQCGYYARHLGHVKGLIENDDWLGVVDKSVTGHVLLMGNTEITNSLILKTINDACQKASF